MLTDSTTGYFLEIPLQVVFWPSILPNNKFEDILVRMNLRDSIVVL